MRFAVCLLVACLSPVVHAVNFTVDVTIDTLDATPGDGVCADANGFCSLRAAIQESNALPSADGILLLARDVFTLSLTSGATDEAFGDLDITDSLIIGVHPGTPIDTLLDLPVINANGIDRVLEISQAAEVSLMGVILMGGNALVDSANPVGGGVLVHDSVNTFNAFNSVISFNQANIGGGLMIRADNALVQFTDVSFNGLSLTTVQPEGAAIAHRAGTLVIRNAFINNNGVDASVPGCVSAVESVNGGAALQVFNTTISGNGSDKQGDDCVNGLSALNTDLTAVNLTVAGNGGWGLRFFDFMPDNFNLFVRNSIFAYNGEADCGPLDTGLVNTGDANGGHNIDADGSCNLPAVSGNQSAVDPQLHPLASVYPFTVLFRYHRLAPTSPAIDQGSPLPVNVGDPNACQQFDQIGRTRPQDNNGDGVARCDIGALESDLIFYHGFDD